MTRDRSLLRFPLPVFYVAHWTGPLPYMGRLEATTRVNPACPWFARVKVERP